MTTYALTYFRTTWNIYNYDTVKTRPCTTLKFIVVERFLTWEKIFQPFQLSIFILLIEMVERFFTKARRLLYFLYSEEETT